MTNASGESSLPTGTANLPQGNPPALDGLPGATASDSANQAEFSSPHFNPDGDWVMAEERRTDDGISGESGYAFSIFRNRFRVERSPGRDETVRVEVARDNRRTRQLGNGLCVTEEDVTYETRIRSAYVLYQAYEYYIVDGNLEWWYDIVNNPATTIGSMAAGAAGSGMTAGGLSAAAAGTGTGLGAVTVGGALLAGGAVFVSVSQAMSEWKSAAEKHSDGWWPVMWYLGRESLHENPDRQTVTETVVAAHPCERPVTGSDGGDHGALPDPFPTDGFGPLAEDDLPEGLPIEEGDLPHDPDPEIEPEDLPTEPVPEVVKPAFTGGGEHRADPQFPEENDWFRDLGERGGYFYLVQYFNRFREVRDDRFDSTVDELLPAGGFRTRPLGDGNCVDESRYHVVAYEQYATRVDQAYQVWRVDSQEAIDAIKAQRFKVTMPKGVGASTASGGAGATGEFAGLLAHQGGSLTGLLGTAGKALGWVGNAIDLMALESAPVPVGAGWTPVGYYLTTGSIVTDDDREQWMAESAPFPCPAAAADGDAASPRVESGAVDDGVSSATETADMGVRSDPGDSDAAEVTEGDADVAARPSPETIALWLENPKLVPVDQRDWAKTHLGYRGPVSGFGHGVTQPQAPEHQNDQWVIEREFNKEGMPILGLTTISTSNTPGEPLTGDGRKTTVIFTIDQFGQPIDRRQPYFMRFGLTAVATVRITIEQKTFRENIAMISVLGHYKRRLAGATSQHADGETESTVSPATAIRMALHAITDEDGNFEFKHPLPVVMDGTITTQPPAPERPDAEETPVPAATISPSRWNKLKTGVLVGAGVAAGGVTMSFCDGPSAKHFQDVALFEMQQDGAALEADIASCTAQDGVWDPDSGFCDVVPAVPDNDSDADNDADVAAGEACTDSGGTFDEATQTCGFADVTESCSPGGELDVDSGVCRYSPSAYSSSLGYWTNVPPTDDPPGGQRSSVSLEPEAVPWTPSPDTDIITHDAVVVAYQGEAHDQYLASTSFPCGAVTEEYRVHCPVGAAELPPGEFVVASMTLAGPIDPTGERLQYGVAFDGGTDENYLGRAPYEHDLFNDTELWYRLEISRDGERVMYADGFRDGVPNYPRHSSALAVEFADTVVFLIPRAELPADLAYRLTTFRNEGSQLEPPQAATAGGDVSGLDVSELSLVPELSVVAELGPDTPPDTPHVQERLPAPTDDGQTLLVTALVADLQERWNAAFATAEVDPVIEIFHPISVLGSADGCRAFVERIFPGAEQITLVWTPLEPVTEGGLVSYTVDVAVSYPTGTTEFSIALVVGNSGRLAPLFSCDA